MWQPNTFKPVQKVEPHTKRMPISKNQKSSVKKTFVNLTVCGWGVGGLFFIIACFRTLAVNSVSPSPPRPPVYNWQQRAKYQLKDIHSNMLIETTNKSEWPISFLSIRTKKHGGDPSQGHISFIKSFMSTVIKMSLTLLLNTRTSSCGFSP